jgi:mono/diheme cytochrome c family protein
MYDQPRYKPQQPSAFFEDGTSARPIVFGTVAYGSLRNDDYLARGLQDGKPVDVFPFPIKQADLERGPVRFNIYCAPCHGPKGDGKGMIVQRGFPAPPPFYGPVTRGAGVDAGPVPSYNDLREAPAGHFVQVMAEGRGIMYSYDSRVSPEDRWRIAAYIRALQLSQYATSDVLQSLPAPTAEEQTLLKEVTQ